MSTDHFDLTYTVTGRIQVQAENGQLLTMRSSERKQPRQSFTGFRKNGSVTMLSAGKEKKSHQLVGLGADGAIYYRGVSEELTAERSSVGWKRVARPGDGPVTVVASERGHLTLFALGEDGDVLHRSTADDIFESDWQSLGGRFSDAVVAAVDTEGTIELFGTDEKGDLYPRSFLEREGDRGEWKRIGNGLIGRLSVMPVPGSGRRSSADPADNRAIFVTS